MSFHHPSPHWTRQRLHRRRRRTLQTRRRRLVLSQHGRRHQPRQTRQQMIGRNPQVPTPLPRRLPRHVCYSPPHEPPAPKHRQRRTQRGAQRHGHHTRESARHPHPISDTHPQRYRVQYRVTQTDDAHASLTARRTPPTQTRHGTERVFPLTPSTCDALAPGFAKAVAPEQQATAPR